MNDRRALAIVCLAPIVCWIACWPFVDMGVNDDWGYAWTVKRLMETGGLRYNGWIAPIVAPQAAWGAAWAAAFGFSHDVLRASTLPLSVACAALAYRLHRQASVPPRWAMFATLVLVTSPLFTPWSASFMTDVPSLAFTLGLFNVILWLARARDVRQVATRAAILALIAIVGGTQRQTIFVFGCVALAAEAWRRRREFESVGPVAGALVALLAATAATIAWHKRQPFAVADLSPPIDEPLRAAVSMIGLALTLAFFLVPLGVAWLRFDRSPIVARIAIGVACLAVCLGVRWLAADAYVANFLLALWSGNTLTPTGLLFDGVDTPGDRPLLFGLTARAAMAAGVFWLLALAAIELWRSRAAVAADAVRLFEQRSSPAALGLSSTAAIVLVYAALLFPRAGVLVVFDRYLLVVMPVVTASLLLAYRRRLRREGPSVGAWVALAIYALVGVGVTYDHFVELRGRLRVADELRAAGFPRATIVNGFSYDGWTQLEAWGYINDPQVTNPPGAYWRDPRLEERRDRFWFLPRTPAVQPRWFIVNATARPPAEQLGGRRVYESYRLLPPGPTYLIAWPTRLGDATSPPPPPPAGAAAILGRTAAVDAAPPSNR